MFVIIEGTEAVGKTTVIQQMQKFIPLNYAMKLSGSPKSVNNREYMQKVYYSIIPFLDAVKQHHVLFDRFCLSERVYAKRFKNYDTSYLNDYESYLDHEHQIVQVLLWAKKETLQKHLEQKRIQFPNEKHPALDTVVDIQADYVEAIENTKLPYWLLNVSGLTSEQIATMIINRFDLAPNRQEDAYTDL